MFAVEVSTVVRWAKEGRIPAGQFIRTPGGRLRIRGGYIRSLLTGSAK
jgi:predicted site-specific integrase-resolvase